MRKSWRQLENNQCDVILTIFLLISSQMIMKKSREKKTSFSTIKRDVCYSYLSCPLKKFPSCWQIYYTIKQALKEIITRMLSFKPPPLPPPPHSHTHTTLLSYTIPVGFPGLIITRPLGLQCSLDSSNALFSSQTSKAQSLSSSKK